MQWFTGSIPEAIGQSRQKGLVFLVYIEGDNEDTQKMNAIWEDPQIAETLSKERCVAIKLDHKSEDCNQFSKLYPIVCIPATYFIGESGLPLEVVGGSLPVDEFVTKANKALETHLKSATNNAAIKPEASTAPQTSEASSSTQQSVVSSMPQEQPASQQSQEASSRDTVGTPGPSQVRQEI
ncbi:UBX domain-containing protein 4 [Desmophyllum pertusum]|uniref:UBX domain-containing protein 4 n=1 Tax=Desmophyllum pertusum TaxID=174260 RepID=A0A9W9YXP8_9CNID|nr:UBX domain-containing protein 4 [Desmophyllum pertusum]